MTVAEGEGFSATIDGRNQRFCAEGCRDFYLQELAERTGTEQARGNVTENRLFDPVCRMEVNTAWGFVHRHEGVDYHFCTERCRRVFADAPDDYLGERCMVCNRPMVTLGDFPATYMGNTYQLCSEEHRTEFKADPAGFFSGIWHGWIAPISLVVGFFKSEIRIYEIYNAGWWYDFGYYMAIISGFGGLSFLRRDKD